MTQEMVTPGRLPKKLDPSSAYARDPGGGAGLGRAARAGTT